MKSGLNPYEPMAHFFLEVILVGLCTASAAIRRSNDAWHSLDYAATPKTSRSAVYSGQNPLL